ncbi:Altronate dehydratase, partial [Diplonema papillatum]
MPKRPFVEIRGPPDRVSAVSLQSIANVAALGDSCAIAVRHLHAGLAFLLSEDDPTVYTLSHEVLEGHRFAVQFVARGKELLSWGLAFGVALKDIPVGGYIVNHLMLHALKGRREVAWALPAEPNFRDISSSLDSAVELDETFTAKVSKKGTQPSSLSFLGYARADGSVGTRNNIVILGITGNSARFARAAVEHLAKNTSPLSRSALAKQYPNIDGIVPVAHNEGAAEQQNNADLVNRVITNYLRHPNVGAAVILASPQDSAVTAETVANELYREHGIDARGLGNTEISNNFAFLNLTDDWQADLEACAAVALQLAPVANSTPRSKQNVSKLRIALQCGGSDAFSGITGNPLVGDVAQRVVLAGGSAILAETPELVGAEPYILQNCASRAVAEEFLKTIRQYMEYADRHKQDAAGNPSGGNLFRGLYNIGLKSLGASRKMPEDTTLDGILPYGRYFPGSQAGYFFMDSPGNDLESIAGQVATGCNLVFFVTGNGAITNFPFVPTLKVVTTSGRFQKL